MGKQEKVLFVVYRAEWWGCFDSLCRRECDKENVTCYVLQIPVYERDWLTGQVSGATKYSGSAVLKAELPSKAVEVNYEDFSWEQSFDRVYIHNPYDNVGVVDVIEEKYCSWNLKKYANKLIYVPHWIYLGGMPQDMIHCPVYAHVDAIYLSEERARYSLDVAYDDKVEIVSCGIREYLDKLNAKKTVKKADAKKRLLYCVSFHDLFYGTEKQIQKMWDILQYMETRRDIEFVFRPDEDIRARYRELPGNIMVKYEELLNYYKDKKIGPLDESLNPYLAAVEADGIMSNGHVMNHLFSVQGKHVLHVNRESRPIPTEEDRCIPSIWACEVEETEEGIVVWFVPEKTRLICRMNLSDGRVEIVSEVPDELVLWNNYIDIVKVGECLYLAPFTSNGIWKYDLTKKIFTKIYLPGNVTCNMVKIISYKELLYFIPYDYPGVVKYDIASDEVNIIDDWVPLFEEYTGEKAVGDGYFVWAVKQVGSMLYMASSKCDIWMEWNLDTDEWHMEKMGMPGKCFSDMVIDGEDVWLLPRRGAEIVCWNKETKLSKLVYREDDTCFTDIPYELLLDVEDSLLVFPQGAEKALIISKSADSVIKEVKNVIPCGQKAFLSEYLKQRKAGYEFVKRLNSGRILLYEYYDGAFLIVDETVRVLDKISCRLPIDAVRRETSVFEEQQQCRNQYSGWVSADSCLPAVVDYFISCDNRELIRDYYGELLQT